MFVPFWDDLWVENHLCLIAPIYINRMCAALTYDLPLRWCDWNFSHCHIPLPTPPESHTNIRKYKLTMPQYFCYFHQLPMS